MIINLRFHRHKWKMLISDLTADYGTRYCVGCLKTETVVHSPMQRINAEIILAVKETDRHLKEMGLL
jgi:hypothetical protein